MKLFGQLVRTMVNVATLPVAVVHDAITLCGALDGSARPHTADHLDKLKREAEEEAGDG